MVVTVWSSMDEFQALAMRLAANVLLPGTGWVAFPQFMDRVGLMMDLLGKRHLARGSLAFFDFHTITADCDALNYNPILNTNHTYDGRILRKKFHRLTKLAIKEWVWNMQATVYNDAGMVRFDIHSVLPKMLFLFLLWILFEFNVRAESIREGAQVQYLICFVLSSIQWIRMFVSLTEENKQQWTDRKCRPAQMGWTQIMWNKLFSFSSNTLSIFFYMPVL